MKLDIEKVTETGKNVRLAIIDQGFEKKNAAFKHKKKKFDIEGLKHFQVDCKKENPCDKLDALAEYRQHGTAVAAIAFGHCFQVALENSKYPGGIAPDVEVTCYDYKNPNDNPTSVPPHVNHTPLPKLQDGDDTILEILKEISNAPKKFHVISMSVYMNRTRSLDDVIDKILKQGTLIIAGSSNEGRVGGRMGYPACMPGVISVGSLEANGNFLSKFTWMNDPYCDVYTFGEVKVPKVDKDSEVKLVKGTSFATPAVAGLVCLAIEYAKAKNIGRHDRQNIIMKFFKNKQNSWRSWIKSWFGVHGHFMLVSAEKDFLAVLRKDFDNFTKRNGLSHFFF